MMRFIALSLLLFAPVSSANSRQFLDDWIANDTVQITTASNHLAERSLRCNDEQLINTFHEVFDIWNRIQLLRIGPLSDGDLAFRFQFWPDPKGFTGRKLRQLIADNDPVIDDPIAYEEVSVAARGLMALEYVLFDEGFQKDIPHEDRCRLIKVISQDLANSAQFLKTHWESPKWRVYRDPTIDGGLSLTDINMALHKMLDTALQFDMDFRLGKPLGKPTRAYPKLAEAWRSGRSRKNLQNALRQSQAIMQALTIDDDALRQSFNELYDDTQDRIAQLDRGFEGMVDLSYRFKVEVIQQKIERIRVLVQTKLAEKYNISKGFNSLDGD